MRVETATVEDVVDVAYRMRERDYLEFTALSDTDSPAELARRLGARYGRSGQAICAHHDDKPVAIGEMVIARPGVATLMFFATDDFPKIAISATRFIKWELFPRYREHGIHRIEAVSLEGYDETHRWLQTLGLAQEAVMPGYGRRAETFRQFAWVRDVGPTG